MIARNASRSLKIRRKGAVRRRLPVHLAPAGGSPEISRKSIDEFLLIKTHSRPTRSPDGVPGMYLYPRAPVAAAIGSRIFRVPDGEKVENARVRRVPSRRAGPCACPRTCSAYELIVPPAARFFPSFLRLVSSPRYR
jgi:hypothetical protein